MNELQTAGSPGPSDSKPRHRYRQKFPKFATPR